MEEARVSRPEDVWEVCAIQKSLQCLQEPFGVQDEPLEGRDGHVRGVDDAVGDHLVTDAGG